MGLRERNAAHTRELLMDTALPLFLAQGYDATTMEDIAERARVSASTLYRYFPSKDALVIDPIAIRGQMAAELRERPVEEPLDLALGHALSALISTPRPDLDRLRQIFTVLESAPALHARLLEDYARERTLLQEAIAERLGRPTDDLFCKMTARVATAVLELVGELDPAPGGDPEDVVDRALDRVRGLTEQLLREPPVLPRLTG